MGGGDGRGARLLRVMLTLGLGSAGGWAFSLMRLPLAWMLGAMVVTTLLALGGVRLYIPHWLRVVMTMVLGVLLGSAFTPALLEQMQRWPLTLLGLAVYCAVATGAGWLYFRRVAGLDPVTAYFAAAPGGFNEMIMVGGEMGGDERSIALAHAARVLFVVMAVPLWLRLNGELGGGGGLAGVGFDTVTASDLLLMLACAVGGYGVARLLRLPAARLVGPMLASGAVHVAGISESSPPDVLVGGAQLVIGASVGARFSGVSWQSAGRLMTASLGATMLLLVVTAATVAVLAPLLGFGRTAMLLAFSPGGLAEMSLMALSLGVEVAFVASHHVARILFIVLLAPPLFAGWRRAREDSA